ncbi:hypothetical protein [Citricoccus sp. GCM10030269]|uniref:hypothetical protein n=1 Tax=Citricoccus sp. GCM10030269 TaxID=3273388 RepID=UPI00361A3477
MPARPASSLHTGVHGSPSDADFPPHHPENSPWLRVLLVAGAALTAVSFACLVLLLASYFLTITAWPVFYWFGLYGFPLGFALMLAFVVTKAVLRRRA